ncbi:unnamed protein product [Lactuca saligna]|uniref:Uncharacterized protein n=1 Tax=Lactuca saligna TaxID=75948 RepID=A0AA35ZGA2_LACSI|nr:unnamed protein product [Lactuca saligna]
MSSRGRRNQPGGRTKFPCIFGSSGRQGSSWVSSLWWDVNNLVGTHVHIADDNGYGSYSILNDTPINQPRRRVRQQGGDVGDDEPPVIPTEDELPIDPYNFSLWQYQYNLGRGVNYTNMHFDLLMQYLNIQRPSAYPVMYPYIPIWNELWREQQSGVSGSGGGDNDKDEE